MTISHDRRRSRQSRRALSTTLLLRDDVGVTPQTTTSAAADPLAPDSAPNGPIVVGIDGSSEARRGLLSAADLATRLGVELLVVHAYGLIGSFGDWRSGVEERERQVRAVLVDEWCAPLADRPDLTWQWRCVQGSAVDGILRAADEVNAGIIVVGSHGAGHSTSPLLGSTSMDIVRHSHRPVLVIPPADDHPHRRAGATSSPVDE